MLRCVFWYVALSYVTSRVTFGDGALITSRHARTNVSGYALQAAMARLIFFLKASRTQTGGGGRAAAPYNARPDSLEGGFVSGRRTP